MKYAPLLLFPLLISAAPAPGKQQIALRGVSQDVYFLPAPKAPAAATVLFIPGDGGWRGTAVKIAETMAGWGYDVYGLDTKRYLTGFTDGKKTLTVDEMSLDMAQLMKQLGGGQPRIVIVGWSQGASMAVLAAARLETKRYLKGIVTLGLPEYGVLGWNWKDTLTTAAKGEPDEPKFYARDFLPNTNPIAMFAIHGTKDDYTPPATAQRMLAMAGGPKQFRVIEGANHRFDGHLDEFYKTLAEGLQWIQRE